MSETGREKTEPTDRGILIAKLTDKSTPLEERIAISRELFPEARKKEILATADRDRKGRPVRYFRMMSYEELGCVLREEPDKSVGELAEKEFTRKLREIKFSLRDFLKEEKLYEELKKDFEELCSDFTIANYRSFVCRKIPLEKLFKLHHIGAYLDATNATGLKSLSAGAPTMQPCDPFKGKPGEPVIEFSIPAEHIFVAPRHNKLPLQDREKEINTIALRPEWIVDVYNGTQDFAERFIKDPTSVLYPEYQKKKEEGSSAGIRYQDYISWNNAEEMLNNWKDSESVADLIPIQKMADFDGINPDLQKPLVTE